MSATTADVVVVGAGIIGSASAFRLAERGLKVISLEAAPAAGQGTTNRSAAGARVQFTTATNVQLSWESIKEYRRFEEVCGVSADYRAVGYLFLVPSANWAEHLQGVMLQRSLGAPVEVIDPRAAQRFVTFDETGIGGTTFGSADGTVDPNAITRGYLEQARRLGASLLLGHELLGAERSGGVWRIRTAGVVIEAEAIVNAAGPWSGVVAARAGLRVPVVPVRRMVYVSMPMPELPTYPLTVDVGSGFYLRSSGSRLLMGRSNPDEPPGFTDGIDWRWLGATLSAGFERFPWLKDVEIDRTASWYGYYETTPDHNPILGRSDQTEGWFDACGFSGHGIQQAAATGRLIAEEVVDGRAHSIDIDTLRIARFAGRPVAMRERHVV